MVEEPIRTGALVEVLGGVAGEGPRIHAVTTAGRARAPRIRAFLKYVVEAFR
jgi:DNA-binding transcriptional LysR family regulator